MQKLIALFALAALVGAAAAQTGKTTLFVGDTAPPLVIAKWAKGTPVDKLGNGKVNVVEFWATWCGPCKESIPHLTELAKKYAGKASFIGVDSFERLPDDATCFNKVDSFVKDFGDKMNYNVAIDGNAGTMGKTWMEAAGQGGIPTAFVIDRDGKIAWIGHPMMGLDEAVAQVVDGTYDIKSAAEKERKTIADQENQQKLAAPLTAALQAKDFRAAVVAADNIMSQVPAAKAALSVNRAIWMSKYDEPGAMKYLAGLVDNDFKADSATLNEIAWDLVMDKSQFQHPDLKLALRAATAAVKLSNDDPEIMDTLSLTYFRLKRTSEAISVEKRAIAKATQEKKLDAATIHEFKTRLESYNGPSASQKQ